MNFFYDVDQEWEEPWYDEELSIAHTTVPGKNTDIQFSYNLGYATSAFGFSAAMLGVGTYVYAQQGFLMTAGFTFMDLAAMVGKYSESVLRSGARSLPLMGLLFFLLYGGTVIGEDIRHVPLDTRVKG